MAAAGLRAAPAPRKPYELRLPDGALLRLGSQTLVMGILNVTPDSFADGGRFFDEDAAVAAAQHMAEAGVDVIDVGGESTRPGAEPLPAAEELSRVLTVLRRLTRTVTVPLSIDTYKAQVAQAALDEGASIVNDVSGLQYDPALAQVVAGAGAVLVLMHTRGRSRDMYQEATYHAVGDDVRRELDEAVGRALEGGVSRDQIVIDPGIGFAKRAEHSWEVLASLPGLATLDRPVLIGPSRKSFLTDAVGSRPPDGRVWATAATVAAGVWLGAHMVRVHDVPEMRDVVRVVDRLRAAATDTDDED